jgi:hypothetical protein
MVEIFKLKKMLDDAGIPYEYGHTITGNDHICYPKVDLLNRRCSIIFGSGTYGYEKGLLEIMGLLTPEEEEMDSVVGYLTAENVFDRISKDWSEHKNEIMKRMEVTE